MTTVVKDSGGIREISVDAAMKGKRVIYLTGEINDTAALNFVKQIMYFAQDDMVKPVKVFINSDGGSLDAGMVIYDAIQTTRLPIELYCIGTAFSMAAIILACGKHGRYILPHSRAMIHEPWAMCRVDGKSSSLKAVSEDLMKVKKEMEEILSKHTGQTVKAIEKITDKDHFFTAAEAVEFGLVDAVKGLDEMLEGVA